jgi:hypothetical protein
MIKEIMKRIIELKIPIYGVNITNWLSPIQGLARIIVKQLVVVAPFFRKAAIIGTAPYEQALNATPTKLALIIDLILFSPKFLTNSFFGTNN